MTSATNSPPAAWRGHRPLARGLTSALLVLALAIVLLGSAIGALLTGHHIDLASVPYLQLFQHATGA
jgi:hypothetical protein